MYKIVAGILTGFSLLLASPSMAQLTPSPVEPGILTISPTMQDLNSTSIVIAKTIYGTPVTFTTVTLKLTQDEKARIVGTANVESNRTPTGKPAVTLPMEFNVTGKIKDGSFSVQGKRKFEEGDGKEYRSRIISLSVKANMVDFTSASLSSAADILSTGTYQMAVNVSGLGIPYNFVQEVNHRAKYNFIYQLLSETEALGLKQPKGGRLYKVWTPYGVPVVKGFTELQGSSTKLDLKGSKFKYSAVHTNGGNMPSFVPDSAMTLKTKYGSTGYTSFSDPNYYGAGFFNFEIYDGGSN